MSVPDGLKFLVGMITWVPSAEETVTETQATFSIRTEIPLPVYIVHSRLRSGEMVDELARLGLSVNYHHFRYMEKKMGLSVIQQFTDEG